MINVVKTRLFSNLYRYISNDYIPKEGDVIDLRIGMRKSLGTFIACIAPDSDKYRKCSYCDISYANCKCNIVRITPEGKRQLCHTRNYGDDCVVFKKIDNILEDL